MKNHLFACSCIAFALLSPASHADTAEKSVIHVVEALTHAIEANDLASVNDLWTNDATFAVFDNGEASYDGWKSFSEHDLGPELATMKDLHFALLHIRPHVAGSIAWVTYEYRINAQRKEGPLESVGTVTMVLRHVNGSWLITHYHISSKRPEAHETPPPSAH